MGEILLAQEMGIVLAQNAMLEYFQWLSQNIGSALDIVGDHLMWVMIGVITGMIMGTIPGMGGTVTLTILLPFTLGLTQWEAFTMLAGGVGATTFTGSITAILINTPGSSSNAATLIDGYPLTQKGESETAITVSAISSAGGAILAACVFILCIPLMIDLVLLFGPAEIFWVVITAIILIPMVVADRPLWGVLTAGLGALVAFVGTSPQTGEPRFTFDLLILYQGVPLISMLIGLFAISEIIRLASLDRNTIIDFDEVSLSGGKLKGVRAWLDNKWLWVRCSLIGLIVGAIPGAGGSAAGFVAYTHAIQSSDDKNRFGKGAIEGVLAPESANDAKDGGMLFPTLGLGIPGSGSMAVFLAALLMHGVFPGPRLLADHTQLVLVIAISILISNILTSVIGLTFAKQFMSILKIPLPRILTGITVLALAAVFIDRNAAIDLHLTFIFAIIGIIMIYLNINRIPFLIAFILAGILERNYQLAVEFAGGSTATFFTGTLNLILIAILVLSLLFLFIPKAKISRVLLS